jgi:DNA-binding XRE family transcriptional regulator
MNQIEFKQALDQIGLNPTTASKYFGVTRQQIYNLQKGSPIPKMMAVLIKILISMSAEERQKWM